MKCGTGVFFCPGYISGRLLKNPTLPPFLFKFASNSCALCFLAYIKSSISEVSLSICSLSLS